MTATAFTRFDVDPRVVGVQNVGKTIYRQDYSEIVHPDVLLIAAAPELLAACKAAWEHREKLPSDVSVKLLEAFARLKGWVPAETAQKS